MSEQPLGPGPDDWQEYGVPAGEERILEPAPKANGEDRQRSRLRPYTWTELKSLPEPEYLVKGVLDVACMSVVYGSRGSGKTFLALDLALHVALGRTWRDRRTRQGRVIYIAAEAGRSIKKRLQAMRKHYNLAKAKEPPLLIIPITVDLCTDHVDAKEIVAQIDALGGAVLIVVDTLSAVMASGNENLPDDMGAFVANIALLRERTGAHVLIVHHSGKDSAKGARGHTKLRAATDTEIEVTDDDGHRTGKVTKQRDGIAGETFDFALRSVEIGTDDEDEPVTSCVVVEVEPLAGKSTKRKITGQAKTALDLLSRAVADQGTTAPASNHIPAGQIVVPLSLWRSYCYSGLASDRDNQDTKRRAFNRNAKRLQELGVIGTWDDFVWIAGQARQTGT